MLTTSEVPHLEEEIERLTHIGALTAYDHGPAMHFALVKKVNLLRAEERRGAPCPLAVPAPAPTL